MLVLSDISDANRERCDLWHGNSEPWIGSDWSNAMCGEAGEAANIVKKIRRNDSGLIWSGAKATPVLINALAEEIADTILYADLLAYYYGIDTAEAIRYKFNKVSEKRGFPQRI